MDHLAQSNPVAEALNKNGFLIIKLTGLKLSASFSHGLVQPAPSQHASSDYWSLVAAWPPEAKSSYVAILPD